MNPTDVIDVFADHEWTVEEVATLEAVAAAVQEGNGGPPHHEAKDVDVSVAVEDAEEILAAATVAKRKRAVSGRYRGVSGDFEIELRVDVDGKRPTRRISGDLFRIAGATRGYFGSFIVNTPIITVSPSRVTLRGSGVFSFTTLFPLVRVTIPRVSGLAPQGAATLVFLDAAGAKGSSFRCAHVSRYFRTVQFEQDTVTGTKAFEKYNTGALPCPAPARTLSVVDAYADAGIEMQVAGASNIVDLTGAGSDQKWSNAELHASMLQQFSLWRDDPQWKVWLLVANDHESQDLRGIMFDQQSRQRQGCAVFYDRIGGDDAASQRGALRTYVHELGHCFNLLHSWQKSFAVPPQPNRVDALSWMNYVQNFPGGANAYWSAFPFQFDDPELIHLRHAFRDHVIMGGANFAIGAAEFDTQPLREPLIDNSGLKLELRVPDGKSYVQGEPVVVEVKLSATDLRGKRVHTRLHPNYGFVQLALQMPNGNTLAYRPLVQQCVETETVVLDTGNPAVYASAYVGYGKDGFYFDQSGLYQLRAIYHALDGSEVVSNLLTLRVRSPLDRDEEAIGEAYSGHDQGTLFYLLGSDAEPLRAGNTALENVVDRHPDHPLAVYAHLIQGINAGRPFKTVSRDKKLNLRRPDTGAAIAHLGAVVQSSTGAEWQEKRIDNITLNMVMRRLARAQARQGDRDQAERTLNDMVSFFQRTVGVNPGVARQIERRTDELRAELAGEDRDDDGRLGRVEKRPGS